MDRKFFIEILIFLLLPLYCCGLRKSQNDVVINEGELTIQSEMPAYMYRDVDTNDAIRNLFDASENVQWWAEGTMANSTDFTQSYIFLEYRTNNNNFIYHADILPSTDSTYDLGASNPLYWANAYIDAIYCTSLTGTGTITGLSFDIGGNSLTTIEWGNLDGLDQQLATTSSPTFANLTVNTDLAIPQSSDPTPDAIGEIAFDTTDTVLVIHDGTAERVFADDIDQLNFTIYDDGDWDNEAVPIWISPKDMAITIVQVSACVSSGTSITFNIEERAFASMGSVGTDVFSSDQAAVATGTDISGATITNNNIAAKSHLVFTTGTGAESGSVNSIHGVVYYRRDVE